jgi:type II secretory pathway component PulF
MTSVPFSPRIRTKSLAGLCRRLAIALDAGLDLRNVWKREADRWRGGARGRMRAVSQAIDQGETICDALAEAGDFFPRLFCELVDVGDQTGHLSEAFAQLADHYENQLRLRRTFWGVIAWPVLQLVAAVLVVGLLIWALGLVSEMTGNRVDILGFGLIGPPGLLVYIGFLTSIAAVFCVFVYAVRRGFFWTGIIQRSVLRLPLLGKSLQTMALSRLAWTLHVTFHAGMEVRRALRLSLESTHNARYTDHVPAIEAAINRGDSLYEAFSSTGIFPPEFLDHLQVGEHGGKVVEAMASLAGQYRKQAEAALVTLSTLAGLAVWIIIAAVIIALIFRIFSFYVGTLNSLLPR